MENRRRKRSDRRPTRSYAAATLLVMSCLWIFFSAAGEVLAAQGDTGSGSSLDADLMKNYVYSPLGKTDPFKPFILTEEELAAKKKRKPRTYLETLDISQLDLIAIVVGPRGNFAMVRDAKGLGYVIRRGTHIGINGGVVHEINEKEVIIKEKNKRISKKLTP